MVLTVTLNPALDKTLYIENLKEGELNRVKASRIHPGGKGINVSKALSSYGLEQVATGIAGGMNGRKLLSLLEHYDFPSEFLTVSGETRVNIKIRDLKKGLVTEINEPGPVISEVEAEKFLNLLKKYLKKCNLMVLSGSLPAGLPYDFYARCIRLASDMNVLCVLDADGEALRAGCTAKPFAIKPNIEEFERLTGRSFSDYSEIRDEIKVLRRNGIQLVTVSLGKEGSIVSYRDEIYHAYPLPVEVKSTVGSGDAMVAAMVYCILNGCSTVEMARITSAAGSLTAALEGSDMAEWKSIQDEYGKVRIEEIQDRS